MSVSPFDRLRVTLGEGLIVETLRYINQPLTGRNGLVVVSKTNTSRCGLSVRRQDNGAWGLIYTGVTNAAPVDPRYKRGPVKWVSVGVGECGCGVVWVWCGCGCGCEDKDMAHPGGVPYRGYWLILF